VRSGAVLPFELAHDQGLFSYRDDHPGFDGLLARAMDSVEALSGDSYATWQGLFERRAVSLEGRETAITGSDPGVAAGMRPI
jgi:hypothetical protein